jgi:hypothetical protein
VPAGKTAEQLETMDQTDARSVDREDGFENRHRDMVGCRNKKAVYVKRESEQLECLL